MLCFLLLLSSRLIFWVWSCWNTLSHLSATLNAVASSNRSNALSWKQLDRNSDQISVQNGENARWADTKIPDLLICRSADSYTSVVVGVCLLVDVFLSFIAKIGNKKCFMKDSTLQSTGANVMLIALWLFLLDMFLCSTSQLFLLYMYAPWSIYVYFTV